MKLDHLKLLKNLVNPFIKALFWYLSGIFFGLGFLWLIFATNVIFHQTFLTEINNEVIMYLCVTLMGGAGTDFFLSKVSSISFKALLLFVSLFFLGGIYFLYNPLYGIKPSPHFAYVSTIFFCIVSFIYCVSLKLICFYVDNIDTDKIKEYESYWQSKS